MINIQILGECVSIDRADSARVVLRLEKGLVLLVCKPVLFAGVGLLVLTMFSF